MFLTSNSAVTEAVPHGCSCGQKADWSEKGKGEADPPPGRCKNCRNSAVSELHILIDDPGHPLKLGTYSRSTGSSVLATTINTRRWIMLMDNVYINKLEVIFRQMYLRNF